MEIYNSEFKNQMLKSILGKNRGLHTFESIISWFTNLKMYASLEVRDCDINDLKEWSFDNMSISHDSGKYFEVLGVKCRVGNREMAEWYQPIIRQREEGITGFIIKKINGVYHLLVQAKLEAGNFDVLEMAPTVQCITGSYSNPEFTVTYLDYFLKRKGIVHFDTLQSEEGGRFYQEQNQNIILEIGENELVDLHPNFVWMTVNQAKAFIKFNNYFNIEARSLLACITPV